MHDPTYRGTVGKALGKTCFSVLFVIMAAAPSSSLAQTTEPDDLLQQFSAQTQRLYLGVRTGIVRVQLPTPRWLEQLNVRHELLQKWGSQLNPQVRDQLIRQERLLHDQQRHNAPSSQPAEHSVEMTSEPHNPLVLLTTGMLIDDAGHAVVPLFVDRSIVGDGPLSVLLGDGHVTTARFLGSDRKTNLTILQLAQFPRKPVRLARSRPDDGTLAMVIAPDGSCRLVVWNSLHAENGLIVLPDSSIAGFSFEGRFLGAAACKPLVDQVVATGSVHRAVLGVRVQEVGHDDALRQQTPALSDRPAIAVLQVDPGSAADHGGICGGDLILSIDNEPVGDGPTFAAVIAARNGRTPLTVLRHGQVVELIVDLQP